MTNHNKTINVYLEVGHKRTMAGALGAFLVFNAPPARMYLGDGGFVKLREVQLTFDVPASLYSRIGAGRITSLRLQVLGRNLATWTDYWGMDPEFSNFGNTNLNRFIDLAPYPPAKQFFFGFDIGF